MIHKIDMADSRKTCGEEEGTNPVVAKDCALSTPERGKCVAFSAFELLAWKTSKKDYIQLTTHINPLVPCLPRLLRV